MMYRYWFTELTGVPPAKKYRLIEAFGSARDVYEATERRIRETRFLTEEQCDCLQQSKRNWRLREEYRRFASHGISLVTLEDEEYPAALRFISHPPYGLYFRGTLPEQDRKLAAVVGARKCSPYGKLVAEELGEALGAAGYGIVSGMAKGIDGYAHAGCLNSTAPTIAVLGCGVDVCYPREHRQLYQRIVEQGCVLSEFAPGTKPFPVNFPRRNRLISGMAQKVIVVEAREKSGSLITADFALEQGRDIYAVPGRLQDVMSAGCNRLIAQGAGIITSVSDFAAELTCIEDTGLIGRVAKDAAAGDTNFCLEKEELLVYSCFDFYPKSIESVLQETGMEIMPLLSCIMNLCEKGCLREYGTNQYVRIR